MYQHLSRSGREVAMGEGILWDPPVWYWYCRGVHYGCWILIEYLMMLDFIGCDWISLDIDGSWMFNRLSLGLDFMVFGCFLTGYWMVRRKSLRWVATLDLRGNTLCQAGRPYAWAGAPLILQGLSSFFWYMFYLIYDICFWYIYFFWYCHHIW